MVESTYNWYWLVDGLMEAGYRVHLANPAAIQQYSGLKYTDDHSDARWLAHVLRLGVLPEGYIYPKAAAGRAGFIAQTRPLVRAADRQCPQRAKHHRAQYGRSSQCQADSRVDARRRSSACFPSAEQVLAVTSALAVLHCLAQQIKTVEKRVQTRLKHTPAYELLQTVEGIGTDFGPDDRAGNGRYRPLSHGGPLCLVLPLCAEYQNQQWQTERPGQRQKWQPVSGAGPIWKRPSLPSASARRCSGFTNGNRPKAIVIVARKAVAHKLARAVLSHHARPGAL